MTPPKTAATEQFPVASLALAAPVRGAVMSFYRFVRRADDIADAPDLPAETKLRRLRMMEAQLDDRRTADPLAAALLDTEARFGTGLAEARILLQAFAQDAVQKRYQDWDELLRYCQLSAVPVGRFLLRIHGEAAPADAPADALCMALQILNHLQDLSEDRRLLDRVYLPLPWLQRAGGEQRFFDRAPSTARREVLDAALDQVESMLDDAACLPSRIVSPRLRVQARLTLACAHALSARLRRNDPVEQPVRLSAVDKIGRVLPAALLRPSSSDEEITRRIVRQSGTSFRFGIRSLTGERRRGLHAVYAFCRAADDLADGAAPAEERLRFLDGWRRELERLGGSPRTPIGRELAFAIDQFDLPVAELRLLLDGLSMDAVERLRLADQGELDFYWRAVAGSVGLLSVRIFGTRQADGFALSLARALQLVNILRDVAEDARRDRVYFPASRLSALGIGHAEASAVIADPAFALAWSALAEEAEQAFVEAERQLEDCDRRVLKPALLMLWSYRPLLARMRLVGWNLQAPKACLRPVEKVRLAWLAATQEAA